MNLFVKKSHSLSNNSIILPSLEGKHLYFLNKLFKVVCQFWTIFNNYVTILAICEIILKRCM